MGFQQILKLKLSNGINKFLELSDLKKSILIVSIIFLLIGITGSFIYDTNDEVGLESLFRGLYLNTPITNIDCGFKGISFLYTFLYANFDFGINYFGISLILLNWWAFILLTFILLKNVPSYKTFWSLIFLLMAFNNIFMVSFTMTSIFASFAAYLLFLYALTDIESLKKKIFAIIMSSIAIVFAYLMRPTSGTLALLLFAPILIWHILFNTKGYRRLLPLLVVVPFLFSLLLEKQVINNLEKNTNHNYNVIDIFAKIVDYGYTLNIQNKNHEKLLYEVNNWFFADPGTYNIINYKNLLVNPKRITSINNLKFTLQYILKSLFNWRSLAYFAFIAVTLSLLMILKFKNVKVMIFYLSIGYFFAVIIAITYMMKMPPWVLMPILTIVIFYILTTIPAFFQYTKLKLKGFILIILVFIFASLLFYQTRLSLKDLLREKQQASQALKELYEYLSTDKPEYVFLTWAYDLNMYPLKYIKWNPATKQIPLFTWISYYPQNYLYLKKLTGSNNIYDIFKWIANNNDKTVIYSDKYYNSVLYKIFAYHNFKAILVPSKILNEKSGKGFYKIY
jgi:hypothetical protein